VPRSVPLPCILAALAATAYAVGFLVAFPFGVSIVLKTAPLLVLTVGAALAAREVDGWLFMLVMTVGAAGDALLEVDQVWGGSAFAVGHAAAIALYARNLRPAKSVPLSQKAAAFALLSSAAVVAWLAGKALTIPVAAYALVVAAMAATAWLSIFSRYRTGIGAVLFLVSDAFIFAEMGGRIDPDVARWIIWPLYIAGQIMIYIGVQAKLAARASA
jgi:uncharacterized membrane protein YhhN